MDAKSRFGALGRRRILVLYMKTFYKDIVVHEDIPHESADDEYTRYQCAVVSGSGGILIFEMGQDARPSSMHRDYRASLIGGTRAQRRRQV